MCNYVQRRIGKRSGSEGRACDFNNDGDEIIREELYSK
jgi:hypothetical protein